jgi:hypothetical protein
VGETVAPHVGAARTVDGAEAPCGWPWQLSPPLPASVLFLQGGWIRRGSSDRILAKVV